MPDPTDPSLETAAQALERAGRHARASAAEAAAALGALLDAASLAAAGAPGAETVPPLAGAVEGLKRVLDRGGATSGTELVDALLGALESEIARWEGRGREDAEARAVLRAFLGLREILWELGLRTPRAGSAEDAAPETEPTPRRKPRKARLQRVPVEG